MTKKDQSKVIYRNLEKQYGFSMVSNLIIEDKILSSLAFRIYSLLLRHAMNKGYCFPGHDRLAKILGKSRSSVIRGLNELKARGLITWKHRGLNKTNLYIIEPIEEIYADKLEAFKKTSDVSNMQHPNVSKMRYQGIPPVTYKEYKVEKEKINNKKLTLDDGNKFSSFLEEAQQLAREFNDHKSIKYYQKIVSEKNKGIINPDDFYDALEFTRGQVCTAQIDGLKPLKNPAGLFVKTLRNLQEKRKQKNNLKKIDKVKAKLLKSMQF